MYILYITGSLLQAAVLEHELAKYTLYSVEATNVIKLSNVIKPSNGIKTVYTGKSAALNLSGT